MFLGLEYIAFADTSFLPFRGCVAHNLEGPRLDRRPVRLEPRINRPQLDVEARVLTVFSRIVGEIIERQRAAIHTADVSANIATSTVLDQGQFRAA